MLSIICYGTLGAITRAHARMLGISPSVHGSGGLQLLFMYIVVNPCYARDISQHRDLRVAQFCLENL